VEARYFTSQLIAGLKHMQSKRVLHRDIKTNNIFLDRDLKLKIGDFGLAVQL